jgi:hypothetical protein
MLKVILSYIIFFDTKTKKFWTKTMDPLVYVDHQHMKEVIIFLKREPSSSKL